MSAYLQMGHNTQNLIGEEDLDEFKGVVLSPVNEKPSDLTYLIGDIRKRGDYNIILDPQLYYPRVKRGELINQPYFPSDFDTTDFGESRGWVKVINDLSKYSCELGINAVASPVILPRRWSDDYYNTCVETSYLLAKEVKSDIKVLTTCLVSITELAAKERVQQIASIITRHDTFGFYLTISADIEPRREISDPDGLYNIMVFIKMLSDYAPVTIAFSSSDMILFKAAGATNCCTSKYFNLRRFTTSRFDEPPTGGGGQLPYWFEHNLLAFLRENDIRRLEKNNYNDIVGGVNSNNNAGVNILDSLKNKPGEAWLAMSWRQYLSWFGKTEKVIEQEGGAIVKEWLKVAEKNWQKFNDDDILMDETRNDGSWIRPWRQALSDFSRSV